VNLSFFVERELAARSFTNGERRSFLYDQPQGTRLSAESGGFFRI
jgi:hypothetical protein